MMAQHAESVEPWRVFYSYSHRDEEARDLLSTYLAPLRQRRQIVEWHDRKIAPGTNWDIEIAAELEAADLILLLVSEHFLASEYCFGVEIEHAMARLKRGQVQVVPILLKPCLWKSSRFSELQMLPRDARPIITWPSPESAYAAVADEILTLVSSPPARAKPEADPSPTAWPENRMLELVRAQVRSLARHYERTRQRMRASEARTARMEQTLSQMVAIATATYPLLDELVVSPSPGERLAAVSILQVFASETHLGFLLERIQTEKPFLQYHALKALYLAVTTCDSRIYPQLALCLRRAKELLDAAGAAPQTDRQRLLREAIEELNRRIADLSQPPDAQG